MSHAIYQTKAVIVGKKNMHESNVLYILYTERFGLVYVSAQSIRSARSKMKFHMQLFSLVIVDLVEGKDIWKLTGVHQHTASLSFSDSEWYCLFARVAGLLVRLVKGEEAHTVLWKDYESLYSFISNTKMQHNLKALELIFVTRTLYHLGYWDREEEYLYDIHPFQEKYLEHVLSLQATLIYEINQRIIDTQL